MRAQSRRRHCRLIAALATGAALACLLSGGGSKGTARAVWGAEPGRFSQRGSYTLQFDSAQVRGNADQFALFSLMPPGNAWRHEWRWSASGRWPDLRIDARVDSEAEPPDQLSLSLAGPGGFLEAGRRQVNTGLPGLLGWDRRLIGAWGEWRTDRLRLGGFAGSAPGLAAQDQFIGRGARGPYLLTHTPVIRGTERVVVEGTELAPGRDYLFDPTLGVLYFDVPILDGVPIEVTYEYAANRPHRVQGEVIGYQAPGQFGIGALHVDERDPAGGLRQELAGVGGGLRLSPNASLSAEWLRARSAESAWSTAWRTLLEWGKAPRTARFELTQVDPGFTVPGQVDLEHDFREARLTGHYEPAAVWAGDAGIRYRQANLRLDPQLPLAREVEVGNSLAWRVRPDLMLRWESEWLRRWDARAPGAPAGNGYPAGAEGLERWRNTLMGERRTGPWILEVEREWWVQRAPPPEVWPGEPSGFFISQRAAVGYSPQKGWQARLAWEDEGRPPEPGGSDRTRSLRLSGRSPAAGAFQLDGEALAAQFSRASRDLGRLLFGRMGILASPLPAWSGFSVAWQGEAERQDRPAFGALVERWSSEWQFGGPVGKRLAFATRIRTDHDQTISLSPENSGLESLLRSVERTIDARWDMTDWLAWQVAYWQGINTDPEFGGDHRQITQTWSLRPAPGWEWTAAWTTGELRRPQEGDEEAPEPDPEGGEVGLPIGAGQRLALGLVRQKGPVRWETGWEQWAVSGATSRRTKVGAEYALKAAVLGAGWERLDLWGAEPRVRWQQEASVGWKWTRHSRLEASVEHVTSGGADPSRDYAARIWRFDVTTEF